MRCDILLRLIKNDRPKGRRNDRRQLKGLLDMCETGKGQQVAGQLHVSWMMVMVMMVIIMAVVI